VGDGGVVYMKAQQTCGRRFDSAFEERLNKLLLSSVLNIVCFAGFQNLV